MSQFVSKIIEITSAVLLCTMFCFAPIAQAEPVPNALTFDHMKTGFILKGVHTTLRCEQCHVDGIFKNTTKDCAGCHSVGSRVGATPKPVNHVQTTSSCDTCHISATSFLVKSFIHVGITSGCASCHNGQSLGVVSKSATHFPTLLPCESCHTNTNTFTSARMDHTGITSNCALCHGNAGVEIFSGVKAKPVEPVAHIPTSGADCSTCHNTTTFLGAMFNHTGITARCDSCHGVQNGVVAKPASHIPTPVGADCGSCHSQANTSNYTTFLGAPSHTPAPSSCASCHNGVTAKGKSSTHIQTTADCSTCHTASNTNTFTTFLGATYSHSPVPATCANCHNGVTATGKMSSHISTTADCGSCHTASNTSTFTTFLGATYSHSPVPTTCANCHNSVIARGKMATHISTTADCSTCHTASNTITFTTFLGAVYTHSPIPTTCASCHNGVSATGKKTAHIATTLDCGNSSCHTQTSTVNFTTFLGATFVHGTITPGVRCDSCHNGVSSTGKATGHVSTTADCGTCHTSLNTSNYITFLGATYVHNPNPPTTGTCSTCHNGTTAIGKSTGHVATTAPSCDWCHNSTNTGGFKNFLGALYIHYPNPPTTGTCSTCHNGSTAPGKPAGHIATTASCDVCHTKTNTGNYTNFLGATYVHSPNPPLAGTCPTCHNGTTATGKPVIHVLTSASCDTCHTQANTSNYLNFLGATGVDHSTIVSHDCVRCHNGAQATGKTAGHIPVTVQCDFCHLKFNGTTVLSFAPGTMDHSQVTGTSCYACHNGSYTSQGTKGAQAMPINHIPTTITGGTGGLPCTTCHATATNYTSWSGGHLGNIGHNNAKGGGVPVYCVTCHLSGTTYLGSMQKKSHNGASTAKDCSSSNCHKPLGKEGTAYSSW